MLALVLNPFVDPFPVPENIAALLWAVIALPLAGAFLCGVLGRFMGRANTNFVACATVAGSFLLSCCAVWAVGSQTTQYTSPASGAPVRWALWLDLGRWFAAGDFSVHYGLTVDRLTAALLLVITGIGFLIHLYSTEYMEHDEGYWRYFAYLNLFVAMMLTLVLADNLVLLFVGWEGVGLCSYLLIGFWYQDTEKAWSGRKAFIANRIGDFAFIIGMILLVLLLGATEKMGGQTALGRANFNDIGRAKAWVTALHDQGPLNIEVLREWGARIPPESPRARSGMNLSTPISTEGPLQGKTFGHVLTAALLLMGKLLIFRAAVDAGLVGLVIVGVLTSAVGAYYYLRVVVYMYMRPAPEAGALPERSFATELALVLSTVAVVVLGVLPGITSTWLSRGGAVFLGR